MVFTVLDSRPDLPILDRLGRSVVLALVVLPPLVMWLGLADNVETPKRLVVAGLGLVLAVATLLSPARRARLWAAPLTWPLFGLALVATVSAEASGIPGVSWAGEEGSWMGAATLVPVFAAAAFAGAWLTGADGRRLAAGLGLAATLSVGYEVVQAAQLDPMPWNPALKGSYWLFASFGNPVHLANFLMAAFWASPLLWRAKPAWGWLAGGVWAGGVGGAGAFATGERSVLLGFAVPAVVTFLRAEANGGRGAGRARIVSRALMAAALAMLLSVTWNHSHAGSPWRLLSGQRLTGARPQIWTGAVRLLRGHPITGVGPDVFYTRFPSVMTYAFFVAEPPVLAGDSVSLRLPGSPHNEPLAIASGLGVVGLGFYVWALVAAARAGHRSALFLAAIAMWCVHLVNPGSVATSMTFWLLLVAAAGPGPGAKAPAWRPGAGRLTVIGGLVAIVMVVALLTTLRACVAQAHRREAGWLVFSGRPAALSDHLTRWDAYAARVHPRYAADDAAQWRQLGDNTRATALLGLARAGNPENMFYDSALADLLLERGKRQHDPAAIAESGRILAADLARAPAALSLYADLAEVADAQGRPREAARLRAERQRLDPLNLFKVRPVPAGGVPPR